MTIPPLVVPVEPLFDRTPVLGPRGLPAPLIYDASPRTLRLRQVDSAQYSQRTKAFDFDMVFDHSGGVSPNRGFVVEFDPPNRMVFREPDFMGSELRSTQSFTADGSGTLISCSLSTNWRWRRPSRVCLWKGACPSKAAKQAWG